MRRPSDADNRVLTFHDRDDRRRYRVQRERPEVELEFLIQPVDETRI